MSQKDPAAVALGRRGGTKTSPRKTAAVRANAKLGGRPPFGLRGELWKAVKAKAARQGLEPREAVAMMLEGYVRGVLTRPRPPADAARNLVRFGDMERRRTNLRG